MDSHQLRRSYRSFGGLVRHHRSGSRAYWVAACGALALLLSTASQASAEIFQLYNKGRIEGERIGTEQKNGKTLIVIKAESGAIIRLSAEKIEKEVKKPEAELWYEAWLPKMSDTVEGHLTMARECKERGLNFEQNHHLLQVIRLDPDNETARRALGFGKIDDKWVRPDIYRQQNGYVRYKEKWWVPQDLAIEREKEELELKQAEWNKKIRLLKKVASRNGDGSAAALAELRSIRDPMAIKTMGELAASPKEPYRQIFMKNLAEIGTPPALSPLVKMVLLEENPDARQYAIDLVGDSKSTWAAQALTSGLESKSNPIVLRAAQALARLKDPAVVPNLIDALHTKHTVVLGGGGNLNLGFSNNGQNGFNAGGSKKTVERTAQNVEVRDALIAITGRNYGYNESEWTAWYQSTRAPEITSLRRGP